MIYEKGIGWKGKFSEFQLTNSEFHLTYSEFQDAIDEYWVPIYIFWITPGNGAK